MPTIKVYDANTGKYLYSKEDNRDELLQETATLLQELQWLDMGTNYPDSVDCPACHNTQDKGHAPDCELGNLIEKLKANR